MLRLRHHWFFQVSLASGLQRSQCFGPRRLQRFRAWENKAVPGPASAWGRSLPAGQAIASVFMRSTFPRRILSVGATGGASKRHRPPTPTQRVSSRAYKLPAMVVGASSISAVEDRAVPGHWEAISSYCETSAGRGIARDRRRLLICCGHCALHLSRQCVQMHWRASRPVLAFAGLCPRASAATDVRRA